MERQFSVGNAQSLNPRTKQGIVVPACLCLGSQNKQKGQIILIDVVPQY